MRTISLHNVISVVSGMFETKESKNQRRNQQTQKLAHIFNEILSKKCKYESELQEYELWCWEMAHGEEIANSIVYRSLNDDSAGKRNITVQLQQSGLRDKANIKLEAYHITFEQWLLTKMYAEDARGNDEGFSYQLFVIKNLRNITEVDMPYCKCSGEVSSKTTIIDNCIDDNCDTWGSMYGAKAESLYFFYITDIKKYAAVQVSYWCM